MDVQGQDKPKASKALGFGPSLKGRALRLLSQREHSRLELEQKLKRYEETPGELAQALDFLQAKDFINDQRVVESVVNRRASKMGVARIQQELYSKGLDAHAMAETLNDLRATEAERARQVWVKKFGQPPQDAREQAQQMRYLLSRGFASETVRRIINQPTEHSE